jgi:DNA ligase-1
MFRPLLSPNKSPADTPDFFEYGSFPALLSSKFDGIRCVTNKVAAMSRTWKPLPSVQVQEDFAGIVDLDGELIEGKETDFDVYNRTQSSVMSFDNPGEISLHVFDFVHPDWLNKPFYLRLEEAHRQIALADKSLYKPAVHVEVNHLDDLLAFESEQLMLGFEGIMRRNPLALYKQGRATMLQDIIYKVKRFTDDEAVVIDVEEGTTNTNEKEYDERGYAKRSSAKAGLVGAATAGRLIVLWRGLEFPVAMGKFNHKQRKEIWENKERYIGKFVKFRYFAHGIKDLPRFPRALGWRDKMDM